VVAKIHFYMWINVGIGIAFFMPLPFTIYRSPVAMRFLSMAPLFGNTTPEPAYRGDFVEEISDDGSTILTKIAKRERPHLIFDDDGTIVALATGICYGDNWALCNSNPWPGHYDKTFTHVQLVARNQDSDNLSVHES
jgi:hypothetical protein